MPNDSEATHETKNRQAENNDIDKGDGQTITG